MSVVIGGISGPGWYHQPDPTGTSPVTTSARTYITIRDSILPAGTDLPPVSQPFFDGLEPDDLSKWLSDRTEGDNLDTHQHTRKLPSVDENTWRITVLEAEIKNKDQRIFDLERDRDDWKAQAQELARRDIPNVQLASPPRRRWWPF